MVLFQEVVCRRAMIVCVLHHGIPNVLHSVSELLNLIDYITLDLESWRVPVFLKPGIVLSQPRGFDQVFLPVLVEKMLPILTSGRLIL